jgi:LysR family transcriptional regulator, low CO2-responsive transcriptional regulator
MRYSQWRAFDAVARELSFSRAAVRLGITQPAVTLQVRALESASAMSLFRRHGAQITLTDAGRTLLGLTRRMFAVEDEIREFLAASKALERGSARLVSDGPHPALAFIAAFGRRHPAITLSVAFGNSETAWAALIDDKADAAVVAEPPPDERLRALLLGEQRLVALLPPSHRLARRRRLNLVDLQDERLLLREQGSTTRRILERALQATRIRFRSTLELGSREAIREAVAMGLGISFVFEREGGGDPRSIAVPLADLEASNRDMLVFQRSDADRAIVRAMIAVAEAMQKATPPTAEAITRE